MASLSVIRTPYSTRSGTAQPLVGQGIEYLAWNVQIEAAYEDETAINPFQRAETLERPGE